MLDQDSNFYLMSLNILITYLLNNKWYYREKLLVNHFRELKALNIWISNFQHIIIVFLNFIIQGINLSSICESGQVTYVDGLSCISKALADESQQDAFKNSQSSTVGNENADHSNPFKNVR